MSTRADETLRAAVRRSLPVLIGLVILGFLADNAMEQLKGPQYAATSQVEVSATPLSSILTNTQPSFVDPQQSQDTAVALAGSPQVYELAARQSNAAVGSAGTLQSATTVTGVPDTDIIAFATTSTSSAAAVKIANVVARAYIAFRVQLHAGAVASTIAKLKSELAGMSPGAQRNQVAGELNRAQLLQGGESNDSSIVQNAVSASKTSPAPLKDSVIGLSLGLVVALLVVALREAVDSTVRSEGDVEDLLSKPVLASVRRLPRRTKLVTYGRHEATFADTYSLLAAQLAPDKNAKKATVLAVTSALSREGKTSTAANLAVSAARRGSHVLLADFDFRKSELSSLFHVPPSAVGALQVIDGSLTLEEAVWSVPLGGRQPSVHRNGHGPILDEDPSESNGADFRGTLKLLSTGGLQSPRHASERPVIAPLLQAMRQQAQLVVIDTPPALLTADMTELAELIDMVIVVVRQGYVSRRSLRSLARHAEGWPTDIAGAVLTDVPTSSEYATYYGAR
jgi:Mrp family chromosome partitioning ATPase/capsular polysaccharide biosynthesis protein